jgi:signal transduction histidine kinase
MDDFRKKLSRIFVVDFLLLIICILGLTRIIQKAGLSPEKHVSFNVEKDGLHVNKIISPGLTKYFVPGDKLIAIAGHAISSKEEIEFVLDSYSEGDIVSFLILRDGQQIRLKIELPFYYNWIDNTAQTIVGLIFFIFGVFVIYKRPELVMANVWHWASVGTAIIITSTWGTYSAGEFSIGQFTRLFFFIAYAFVPSLFIHLSFVFPRYKWPNLKKLSYLLYGFSTALAITLCATFLMASSTVSLDWFNHLLTAFNLNRLYFAVAMTFGVANIFHSSIHAQEESERRQIRWVVFGLAIGPPAFVFLWQLPQVFSVDLIVPEFTIVLVMLIVPVTFSIAIVKYHVFDIDHIFRRSSVYFFTALILLVMYAALVGLSVLFIGFITVESSLVTTVVAAILTPLIFEPLRRFLQKMVDQKFFRVRYNYRLAQQKFTQELNTSLDKESIVQMTIRRIDDLLQVKFSGFYIKNEQGLWELSASKNFGQFSGEIIDDLVNYAQNASKAVLSYFNMLESGIPFEALDKKNLKITSKCLMVPLKSPTVEIIGMLILGRKKSGQKFTLEDIGLLKTIGIQLGLALQRTELQKQLLLKNLETERLNELNRLKSYFVSGVSHDLQSPLTSIKMFAELLAEKESIPKEKQKEYLKIIEGESARLSRLIKNVLDFSKIERGKTAYNFREISLNKVLKDVLHLMDYQFKQRHFRVKTDFLENDIILSADEDALCSGFINVLTNSIKYSDKQKEIHISTQLEDGQVVVKIADMGIGISDEDQQHIFDTFYRSQDASVQSSGGVGLGLSLVAHVVKAHKGTIKVESKLGEGTVFILSFPLNIK